jgi:hypothetical protein
MELHARQRFVLGMFPAELVVEVVVVIVVVSVVVPKQTAGISAQDIGSPAKS